ncbi:hypothetical protein IFM89_027683 [Coptis chinensis]|uniref:dCMP deaminase n=1 Tax=Coptis chinensis TaxID=261450 RepID=A0A835IXI7_9MAGN|nr:hypothetical protein IFM89_027683 [Coptis chinensis]
MNSKELVLVSAAAIFGSVASAVAFKFFFQAAPLNDKVETSQTPPRPCPFDPSKRKGCLSWDDYFMAIAFLSAERSKDPNRQVGACLVSENGIILGIGYNGFPRGCSDDKLPWAKKSKTGNTLETKYPYVCHAEVNAILNTNHASAAGQQLLSHPRKVVVQISETWLYVLFLGQSGVTEVIYFVEKKLDSSDTTYAASHILLSMAGIKRALSPDQALNCGAGWSSSWGWFRMGHGQKASAENDSNLTQI